MSLITFDIETWGLKPGYTLQPWRAKTGEAGILSIAKVTNGDTVNSHLLPSIHVCTTVLNAKEGDILCGWNLKFDLSFMLAIGMGQYLRRFRYLDGMLLLKKLGFNLQSHGLKQSLKHFKEHLTIDEDYNKDIEFKIGEPRKAYTENELVDMVIYNIKDADYTMQLIKYLISIAPKETVAQAIRESTASLLFADAWQRGILIDRDALDKYTKSVNDKCDKLEALMKKVNLTPKIIASPMQLRSYLINELRIKLTEKTEKGAYSVNSKVLKNLYYKANGHTASILRLIIKYKEFKTEQSKFVTATQKCLQESDLIHPNPILSGTYTGRLTYSMYQTIKTSRTLKNGKIRESNKKIQIGIQMHQIKKTGQVRNLFVAPEGYSLVELDFCAQEMRLIACMAEEATMIKLFNENKDMHAFTAAGIAGMQYDDFITLKQTDPEKYNSMRKLGKLTNLALQYRLGARGLYKQWHDVYGLTDKTEQDAQLARATYLRIYPGIPRYWATNPTIARQKGYVESKGHRRCSITKWDAENEYRSSQTAINFPVQATGADQKILALYYLRDHLYVNGIQFAWDLHDGMFFYVPDELVHTRVTEMVHILNELPYEKAWGWKPQVKFPVEAKIGKRWGVLSIT